MEARLPIGWYGVVALVASFLAAGADAQRRKLNGPLEQAFLTQVEDFALGDDGTIVYQGGEELFRTHVIGSAPVEPFQASAGGLRELTLTSDGARAVWADYDGLYSATTDGAAAPTLLASMVGSPYLTSFQISPDEQWVVYLQSQSNYGLYSVPIDGSAPPVWLTDLTLHLYQITPDSAHVLFSNQSYLRTVPIDGSSPPIRLQPLGRRVWSFAPTPDGTRVVYTGAQTGGSEDLFSSPTDGSAPATQLNPPLVAGGNVGSFAISPDSSEVAYAADQVIDETHGLFRVPVAGGAAFTVVPGSAGRSLALPSFSPDGTRLLYRANHAAASLWELYSVPPDASAPPVKLSGTLAANEIVGSDFRVDGSSERVVFRIASPVYNDSLGRLLSAPLDGSTAPVLLSPAGELVAKGDFAIGAERVVFRLEAGAPNEFDLWSASLDGALSAIRLHPELVDGGSVYSYELNSTGLRVLYRAEQDLAGVIELFVVPLDGSLNPRRRSDNRDRPTTVGDVHSFKLSPDGATAVYYGKEEAGLDLYAVNLAGTPHSEALGVDVPASYMLAPDSARVVYTDGANRFYSVPVDASAPPLEIASGLDGELGSFQVSPDSSRLVIQMQEGFFSEPDAIFSVPVAGGAPVVELNTPRAIGGQVSGVWISPDSARVVYVGIQETPGMYELFSAPLAGGAAPVKLNDALPAGGDVAVIGFFAHPVRITADSSRVVYVADRAADNQLGLYSVPPAGGATPLELALLPDATRTFLYEQVSPDSSRAVYVADADVAESFELYSVPLDGSTAPVELSALPASDRSVQTPFLLSPDSAWVVYAADQEASGLLDLYRAPLDGGAPPLRLTLASTTDALDLLLVSADSRLVVYSVSAPGSMDLFAVSLQGGQAPVHLNGALVVSPLQFEPPVSIDPSGRWALFHAETPQTARRELYAVPLAGGSPFPVPAPLVGDSPATPTGAFVPGTSAVVYLAEQDEAGVRELYLNELGTQRPGHHLPR